MLIEFQLILSRADETDWIARLLVAERLSMDQSQIEILKAAEHLIGGGEDPGVIWKQI